LIKPIIHAITRKSAESFSSNLGVPKVKKGICIPKFSIVVGLDTFSERRKFSQDYQSLFDQIQNNSIIISF
jgi:hypothetical protein